MRNTTLSTYPASYSELCDIFRPRLAVAKRTDSGRERFIDFLVASPVRSRFVAEHASEGRPASIQDGLRLPACIAGEVRSVLDLALRQRPGIEHSEGVSREAKSIPLALEIPAFQGHPAQRAPAAPPQERPIPLTAGLGVLLTDGVDGACMQRQFLAAARGQPIEIEPGRPALVPFQCVLLSLVAEIPDEIAGARLAIEQPSQRLDAVSVHQQHRRKLMRLGGLGKTSKLTETSTFTRPLIKNMQTPMRIREPRLKERHFLPAARARMSVPEKR